MLATESKACKHSGMSLPFSVHSREYLERLSHLRDIALEESHWFGMRRSIGNFTLGAAHARWRTEEGGIAHLIDEGLRHKRTSVTKLLPTTLRLMNSPGVRGVEVVTYKMELDDIGSIEIYRNLITKATLLEVAKAELHKRAERRLELDRPTVEQREQLYEEMERGASGLYTTYSFESED